MPYPEDPLGDPQIWRILEAFTRLAVELLRLRK